MAEGERRNAPVHLVLVNDDPARNEYAQRASAEIGAECRNRSPAVDITEEVVDGHPVEELIRRSKEAVQLVLGSRGRGGFTAALLGSVSSGVAMRGACPVVVVRGEAPSSGPVVVGVDGSPNNKPALSFAFAAAQRRGAELLAVQAVPDFAYFPRPDLHETREELRKRTDQHLAELLTEWVEPHPDVVVRRSVVSEQPVVALDQAVRRSESQLLVVGHRGAGGFTGMFIGSVASAVVHHATYPVVVVRGA